MLLRDQRTNRTNHYNPCLYSLRHSAKKQNFEAFMVKIITFPYSIFKES